MLLEPVVLTTANHDPAKSALLQGTEAASTVKLIMPKNTHKAVAIRFECFIFSIGLTCKITKYAVNFAVERTPNSIIFLSLNSI